MGGNQCARTDGVESGPAALPASLGRRRLGERRPRGAKLRESHGLAPVAHSRLAAAARRSRTIDLVCRVPGWHLPNSTTSLTINSDTPAQLTLDGRPVIALIIAAGAALDAAPNAAQQAAGCVARMQNPALSIPPNPRDYLECYSGTAFRSNLPDNGANPVSNDQVVAITAADLLPALEGAIAKRIERDVVPELRLVYASAT